MRFLVIILLFTFTLFLVYFFISKISTDSEEYSRIKINDIIVNAEIADTQIKKLRGLMGRTSLDENQGMLFYFSEEEYYSFWMYNMLIPVDIIFISKDKIIVDIWKDAQPCRENCTSYVPKKKSTYILEVKANFTDRHNVTIGSNVYFSGTN